VLCDEPTGNLDTATTEELTSLLGGLHQAGATLLVITHNPAVAARAQRRITISDGHLEERTASPVPAGQNEDGNAPGAG
jgi:putative ABC transport system ATP-binding protein